MELTDEEQRVLGCLLEKERTVPDTYPMTLKALVGACNQSSSRWPVVNYDEGLVQRTLDQLKLDGWVRFVHPMHGERSTKYRQVFDEKLGLSLPEAAVLCVLLVRGPQSAPELKTRTERLYPFDDADEVLATLGGLAGRQPEPLVVEIGRRPGEREDRWAHAFGPVPELPAGGARAAAGPAPAVAELEARVTRLEALVADLYARLGEEEPASTA